MGLLMLDFKGILLALILGLLIYNIIGLNGLILLFIFLIISVIVSKTGYYEKKEMGVNEKERGWLNVYSNGIMPLAFAVLSSKFGIVPFISSVASAMADKFGSELGIFDDNVFSIIGWKRIKPGLSGGVSPLGTFASLVGSLIISLSAYALFNLSYIDVIVISISGFFGSLIDSLAGYYEEKGIGNKAMSNIMGTLFGGVLSIILMKMIGVIM